MPIENIPPSLINLAKDIGSKPARSFSEFISLKLFGKSIARLKAEADNEYEKVRQLGKIEREVSEPFLIELETAKAYRQYSNLGEALEKAKDSITTQTSNIKDDNDVFWGLLEHAKEVSNKEVQDLIAKIIAGEYNNPETYSMSTLQILKSLGKKEIELFEKVCGLLLDKTNHLPKILFSGDETIKTLMQGLGLHFGHFQALQSLGLFLPNDMTRKLNNNDGKKFQISYFDKKINFIPQNDEMDIRVPDFYGLSIAGEQILQHLKPKFHQEYYDWLKNNYKIPNYSTEVSPGHS